MDVPGSGPRPEDHVADLALDARPVIPLLLSARYVDCSRHLYPQEPGYTIQALSPFRLCLDYLFACAGLAPHLVESSVVSYAQAFIASHHLPIRADFQEHPRQIPGG